MRSARTVAMFLLATISAICALRICNPPAVSAARATAARHYKVIDLGNIGGGLFPTQINNNGEVVGGSYPPLQRAFLWRKNKLISLEVTSDSKYSGANGINDHSEIVGVVSSPVKNTTAVVWKNGKPNEMVALGGKSCDASAVNNKGEITGTADLPNGDEHAYLFNSGKVRDLGTLGGAYSETEGINDRGQVVGDATMPGPHGPLHAFLYSNGKMHDLGTLPGYRESSAMAINNSGEIVGHCDNRSGSRACLWRNGHIVDLGTMGGTSSLANAVNDKGDIVGHFYDGAGNTRAFLVTKGKMADLNTLLVSSPGWVITSAIGINNHGEIIGGGKYKGQDRAVLLEPVPAEH